MRATMQRCDMNEHDDPPSSQRLLLFPAYNIGDSELLHFIKSLERADLADRVLLVCPADFATAHAIDPARTIVDEFDDVPALVEKVAAWKNEHRCVFTGIVGIDEEVQFRLSRKLARRFGLEFYGEATCAIAANKYLQKRAFSEHGVPTSDFALCTGRLADAARRIGFPSVLKALSGTQSHFVFFNRNAGELAANLRRMSRAAAATNGDPRFARQRAMLDGRRVTLDPKSQFLLEAYVPGDEYSCDFLVRDGAIKIIRVTGKLPGSHFGYAGGYRLLNEAGLARANIGRARLEAVCRGIARALGIDAGVCMVDFKKGDGGIVVLETSIRPGLSAFNHLMYDICGYTSLALMAMEKLGRPVRVELPDARGAVVYLYDSADGVPRPLDTPLRDDLFSRCAVTATHLYRDDGGRAADSAVDHSALLRGYVVLNDLDGTAPPPGRPAARAACGIEAGER
ncbi:MAG: hypothetical protein JW876_09950 [Candidatus Krumholzibacteriota bacterium]|nr:hypothetical protein [Candidatus Krumholzibacteriota bacterium]